VRHTQEVSNKRKVNRVIRLPGLPGLSGLCLCVLVGLFAFDARAENPAGQPQSIFQQTSSEQDRGNKIPDNHIGAFFGMSPSYSGSNKFSKTALPDVDVTIDKRIFINTDNGVGAYLINQNGWTFGPSIFVRLGRYQLSQSNLRGLHTIKLTPEMRLSGGYDFGVWDISAAFSHDVEGGGGNTFELKASTTLPMVDKLYLMPSISMMLADREFMNTWYGITEAESTQTRYKAFHPRGGIESFGSSVSMTYLLDKNWAPFAKVDLRYLMGPAANSPLASNRLQATFGVGLSYLFD